MRPKVGMILAVAAMMDVPFPVAPVRHEPIGENLPPRPLSPADVERIEAAKAKRARRAAKRKGTV